MCPFGQRLLSGQGSLLGKAELVCHVLLVEAPDGLVLVDTGFGTGDVRRRSQLGRAFNAMVRPQLQERETALEQVKALGFQPADVRHIVLTHLDLDHAGGLVDFPSADVHVFAAEHQAQQNPRTLNERQRYIPAHFAHGPSWVVHDVDGDQWLGFDSVRVLPGEAEVLMIPLPGHTRGHTAIALRGDDGWLLHCGDAYFFTGEVETPRRCPPGLRAFQDLTNVDRRLRVANQERLRELRRSHGGDVHMFCSHDPTELARSRANSMP